jgi:hypothetical protein
MGVKVLEQYMQREAFCQIIVHAFSPEAQLRYE